MVQVLLVSSLVLKDVSPLVSLIESNGLPHGPLSRFYLSEM